MKNKIIQFLLLTGLFLTLGFIGCKKDKEKVDDSNKPSPVSQSMYVSAFSPAEGGLGSVLLINGTGFTSDSSKIKVTINGSPLRIVCTTGENVVVQVMNNTGSGPIVIKIGDSTVTSKTNFQYKTLQISSFSPTEGGVGTFLTIYGVSFTSDVSKIQVSINGVPLKIVDATSDKIVAQFMSNTGSGPVVVKIGNDIITSNTIFQYNASYIVSTFAGSGGAAYTDAKGTAAAFNFGAQAQLGIDANDNLFVPDRNNNKFRKITPDGTVTTFAGQASFSKPCAAGVDPYGNIWLADRGTMAVYKCTPDGSTVTKIMRTDTCSGGGGLTEIYSLAFDDAGGVYWSDNKQNRIIRLKNGVWTSVVSCPAPGSMVMDVNKNIYASLANNHTIKKYTYNATNDTWDGGVVIAGQDGQSGWVDGIGSQAKFATPWALALDQSGNLLCSGQGMGNLSNCVRQINLTTPFQVTTIAGKGDKGFNDGTGSVASFNGPVGIVVSKSGFIFVLDRDNNRIRKIEVK